jgi:8-oxo-dGTP pyrophosphatase MutT (NUDIX family)
MESEPGRPWQQSVRAVMMTPAGMVLLMKVAGPSGDLWITPGGRIRPGEDPAAALVREIQEETGCDGLAVGPEIWVRYGTYTFDSRQMRERERFFLIMTDEFEPSDSAMEQAELTRHRGFRWWSIPEIAGSPERFVPRRLAILLTDLRRSGPPAQPVESHE